MPKPDGKENVFKTINDVLYKSNNFKVVITLFGNNDPSTDTKFKRSDIIKIYKDKNSNDDSVYLDTYNRSILGFCTIKPQTEEGYQKGESIYFSQKSFYDLIIALNICIEWMRSKNFKYLFDITSEGVVKGLGGTPPYHPIVFKNQSEFIRFYPAIVRDLNGVNYEGISIRSQKSYLTQFTCMEFFTFASSVKNYISNLYCNNLQLLNIGLYLSQINKN